VGVNDDPSAVGVGLNRAEIVTVDVKANLGDPPGHQVSLLGGNSVKCDHRSQFSDPFEVKERLKFPKEKVKVVGRNGIGYFL
jgi:hypothetical protein